MCKINFPQPLASRQQHRWAMVEQQHMTGRTLAVVVWSSKAEMQLEPRFTSRHVMSGREHVFASRRGITGVQ